MRTKMHREMSVLNGKLHTAHIIYTKIQRIFLYRNLLTVTSYGNALEQAGSRLTVLQAKAVNGNLSGCFQVFAKLKSISIKLWCVCTNVL